LSQNVKKQTICAIFASKVKVIRITFLNEDEGNGFFCLFWKKAVSRKELTSLSKSTTALTQLEPVGFLMLRGRLCRAFTVCFSKREDHGLLLGREEWSGVGGGGETRKTAGRHTLRPFQHAENSGSQ
jgi:hypothetical protein